MTRALTKAATRIEDLTWVEFEKQARETPYWILIAGSTEQHGPHLPLGADTLVAERLAEIMSAEHGAMILGSVRVGVLHAFQDWPGSQRLPHPILTGQVEAMAQPVAGYRKRLLILNGHDENHEPLLLAARSLVEQHDLDVVVVEWAQMVSDVIKEVSESRSESHGGEGLTSVFLHWYPERVRTELIAEGTMPTGELTRDDLHVSKRAHHVVRFRRQDVPSGVLGDPRLATADKGKVVTEALISRLGQLVRERGWL